MTNKKIETLEKLVISLLVQIQEIKFQQENVNRDVAGEVTGSDRPINHSCFSEHLIDLIFVNKAGIEIE